MISKYAQHLHQGMSPGRPMTNGGGGGGSSNPDTRYANLDKLYGIQTQASEFMLNNAMPYIPGLTENSAGMVSDAMDGTLASQMRDQAGNNAQMSLGAALDANQRGLQRFGMGMSANRAQSESNRNAIMGAGMKVGEMNKANVAAEDMKWNRNANFYGQVMGMNNGAMQGLSSSGAGMNAMNAQQGANDRANAQGYGQAGAAFSNALFKADGGYIDAEPARLASGGDAWTAYKAANPVAVGSYNGRGSRQSPVGLILGGAMPGMAGAGLKDVLNFDGKGGKIVGGLKKIQDWYKGPNSNLQGAPDYANSQLNVPDYTGFDPSSAPEMAAGYDAATAMGSDAASTGLSSTYDGWSGASSAGSASADTVAALSATSDTSAAGYDMAASYWAADGGYISGKRAQGLAMGGMPTVSKMSVADNSTVAQNDSNRSMDMTKMDDFQKAKNAVPAGASGGSGYTTGMGETSNSDPDGFGKESPDMRHYAGSAVLSYFMPKGTGGLAATALHPIMEPLTRELVTTGEKITGNSAGSMLLDPIGTPMSGKYSAEQIAGDWAKEHGKITAGAAALGGDPITAGIAGKLGGLFSEGGNVEPTQRIDHTGGGNVRGPGTETSDDIPAWLSDGEFVLNAEAVKIIGKDKLEALNNQGLKARGQKPKSKTKASGLKTKKGR